MFPGLKTYSKCIKSDADHTVKGCNPLKRKPSQSLNRLARPRRALYASLRPFRGLIGLSGGLKGLEGLKKAYTASFANGNVETRTKSKEGAPGGSFTYAYKHYPRGGGRHKFNQ